MSSLQGGSSTATASPAAIATADDLDSHNAAGHHTHACTLAASTIARVESILQRGHLTHALLMLLAKAWAWAALKAAFSRLPAASTHQTHGFGGCRGLRIFAH